MNQLFMICIIILVKKLRPSHRILAITRGEKEKVLKVKLDLDEESVLKYLERETLKGDSIFKDDLILCIEDSYKRLIKPSIEREIRGEPQRKQLKFSV